MNIQFRNVNTYLPMKGVGTKQLNRKEEYKNTATVVEEEVKQVTNEKINVKNATFEEISNVLNDIAKENGDEKFIPYLDLTHVIEMTRKFLNSPRNPNPSQRLVVEGNAMFEGYGGVKSDWTELFERKAKQQLALGNKDGYDRFMKSSNDLKEYYEKIYKK